MRSRDVFTKIVVLFVVALAVGGCASGSKNVELGRIGNTSRKIGRGTVVQAFNSASNPFKSVAIVPFRNRSDNPRATEEVTDIVLTELYFSNIFDEIVENDESKKEMKKFSEVNALINKNLIISIGDKLAVDGLFLCVINDDSKGDDDLSFDATFALIDAASGEKVWSIDVSEKAVTKRKRVLFIKNIVKIVLSDFKAKAGKIKRKVVKRRVSPLRYHPDVLNASARSELQNDPSHAGNTRSRYRGKDKKTPSREARDVSQTGSQGQNLPSHRKEESYKSTLGYRGKYTKTSSREYQVDNSYNTVSRGYRKGVETKKHAEEEDALEGSVVRPASTVRSGKKQGSVSEYRGGGANLRVPIFKYLRRKRNKKVLTN